MPRLLVGALSVLCACSPAQSPEPVRDAVPMTVCAALSQAPGSVLLVHGEFDGFGYATGSRQITLLSDSLCNEDGAAILFVELRTAAEADKARHLRPRRTRPPASPGDRVTIAGIVESVRDRTVRMVDGSIR